MRLLDSSDPMVSRTDDDDLHRQAIDAAIRDDDGATRIGLDPYPAEERDADKLDAAAYWSRHLGTGLRSVFTPEAATPDEPECRECGAATGSAHNLGCSVQRRYGRGMIVTSDDVAAPTEAQR